MPEIPFNAKINRIDRLLRAAGASEIFFVGGFVRDLILGIPSKDLDLEIYGLTYQQILDALRPCFRVDQVGQSFSVIKVENEIDLAIPRRERKIGTGHKAFEVVPDSSMTFREAAARRDFTINAIGMRLDGTFCDPYDGLGDLKRGILRAPTEAFCEDPLRVLRGMQFAARFGFRMESRTVDFCRRVRSEFGTLSAERLYSEWEKWALKGNWPEKGLDVLRETGWIECFPDLAAMVGTAQDPKIHPEGDVWNHTRNVCVSAARIARNQHLSHDDRLLLMLSALLHDVGKPTTFQQRADGSVFMPNHAEKGARIAEVFLQKMRAPISVSKAAAALVRCHDAHAHRNVTPANVRHLAVALTPANLRLWRLLASADLEGRGLEEPHGKLFFDDWFEEASRQEICDHQPEPLLFGRDLEPFGIRPGKEMGQILREAWVAQLDGEFLNHEGGLRWLTERLT